MSATDDLLRNARAHAEAFAGGGLPIPPARRVAVIACMDARVNPYAILGLAEGDAHIIRNAGGIVTDSEIRSLALSQHLLGTEEVELIHHTDCGVFKFSEPDFVSRLERETGARPPWEVPPATDLEASVRESVRRVRESPFVPHKQSVRGFVYDVETGRLREVR
jgi:carbonic anhydrase